MEKNISDIRMPSNSSLRRCIIWMFGIILFVVAILIFVIWYGETRREKLLASYKIQPSLLADISTRKNGPVSLLMKDDEKIVCAIGSYGSVEQLPLLTSAQKSSLPKDDIPSEDLTWYLMFFGNSAISRVYLIDSTELEGAIEGTGAGCVERDGRFVVLKSRTNSGENKLILNLFKANR